MRYTFKGKIFIFIKLTIRKFTEHNNYLPLSDFCSIDRRSILQPEYLRSAFAGYRESCSGKVAVFGRALNDSGSKVSNVFAAAFLFGADGELLAAGHSALTDRLAKGETAAFEITFDADIVDPEDVAGYRVTVFEY